MIAGCRPKLRTMLTIRYMPFSRKSKSHLRGFKRSQASQLQRINTVRLKYNLASSLSLLIKIHAAGQSNWPQLSFLLLYWNCISLVIGQWGNGNGVGALRGQLHIPSKINPSTTPGPRAFRKRLTATTLCIGATVLTFSLFLTSCKRPLDAWPGSGCSNAVIALSTG